MTENSSNTVETVTSSSADCVIKTLSDSDLESLCQDQKDLLAYFQTKTGGTRLASRADLNPADLKPMLPMMAIHDVINNDDGLCVDFKIRLLGTKMVFYYGERTGYTYADLAKTPELAISAARILSSIKAVVAERAPIVCTSSFQNGKKKWLDVAVLYIPLSKDGSHINMALSYADIKESVTID